MLCTTVFFNGINTWCLGMVTAIRYDSNAHTNKEAIMVRLESAKEYTHWVYYGRTIPYAEYLVFKAKENQGECPFCGRTGLTGRYGSKAKHLRACSKITI